MAARRARVDGDFGVLEESDAPIVDLSDADDPIWEQVTVAVQAADSKRGVDISAAWIREGYYLMIIITALSRPQIQAIGTAIRLDMKKKLRMKQDVIPDYVSRRKVRSQASGGWLYMQYSRMQIHIMTPIQRSYYDLEGLWRDEYEDYEQVDVAEILREETFGNLKLTNRIAPSPDQDNNNLDGGFYESPLEQSERYEDVLPEDLDEDDLNDPDEDDPFWS